VTQSHSTAVEFYLKFLQNSQMNHRKAASGGTREANVLASFLQWGREILRIQIAYGRVLGADRPEFNATVAVEKLRTARVGALGLFIINLTGFLFLNPRLTQPFLSQSFYHRLVLLYAMNIVFCLLYTVLSTFVVARRNPAGRLSESFSWVFLVWVFWVGVVFTINGQNYLDHLINYLFALAFVTVAFPLPALPSLALYAAAYVALFLWLAVTQHNPAFLLASRGNAFTSCVLAWLLSRVIFSNRVTSFSKSKLIERQAHELALERSERTRDRFCLEYGLTPSERRIMGLVLDGMVNKDIAHEVFVSHDTVKKHVYHIFRKAGVKNRFELARFIENGDFEEKGT
jgi:DNA-binding CsgD family transcriptional regulator